MQFKSLLIAFAASLIFATPFAYADDDAEHPAARVVSQFNQAVTARDMDTAMALLAEGSVQFHLHAVHPGMSDNPPLTEDMPTMWKTVSAILFPTTESYARLIEVTDVEADGELAVVWTQTKTVTNRKGVDKEMVLNFSEMYFLVNKDNTGWKIAGTATNRPIDDIPVG